MGISMSKYQQLLNNQKRASLLYAIGIDTGTHTGVAVWDCKQQEFVLIKTMPLHEALFLVQEYVTKAKRNDELHRLLVRVEDARQRKWFGQRSYAKLQGAGSVKRDSTIWDEYLKSTGVSYNMVSPADNSTKLNADQFKARTGYRGSTNEHNRDAAMLVYGA